MSEIHLNKKEGSQLKLFTPGPVEVPDRILEELKKPNDTHRSTPYSDMHKLAKEGLQKLLYTKNDCFIFTSSATGVMEACIRNLVGKEEKALIISIGAFGDRWYDIGIKNGKEVVKEPIEWGNAATREIVKKALKRNQYSVVCLQANETSTGVYNPIYDIVPIIKDCGALVCIDATSSMAGVKLEVDKLNIDVCLASVQKCFALPPGLAVASISEAALEKSSQVENRGHYFDFQYFYKKSKVNQTPTTPPIPHIRALVAQLNYVLEQEGLENRFKRHTQLGKRTRMWARDIGMKMFSQEGFESNTVSTMENTLNLDFNKMVSQILEKGYRIVNGYGSLANKTFRIGHMGEITLKDLEEMLKVLTDIISDLRLEKMG
ncbi:MAG: aminotransferase class V-fold PLP-dependent enzyme [Candidatus Lokiarchaeota archaeon]|nr:aminotransferase class V-fold PLP-dependent enzyme [Candidatus Lokiarchaeota archaeon]MBD3199692.1 aminotransferase class V-fold PLP-dependent enzyme [Candidatus Lokiarchaeota archaeon]